MARGPKPWFFDAWSRVYDLSLVQRVVYRPPQDAVLRALRAAPCWAVLDIGCGTGQLAARLRRELPRTHVVGCDFSAGMLAEARVRDRHTDWVQGDAGRLPFADAAFDAVVSTEAFHWFPDPGRALAEFRRVLRPAGRLLLALVNPRFAATGRIVELASRVVGQPFRLADARRAPRPGAGGGVPRGAPGAHRPPSGRDSPAARAHRRDRPSTQEPRAPRAHQGALMTSYTHDERLSALDASFLELEDGNTPHAHRRGRRSSRRRRSRRPDGGIDIERIRAPDGGGPAPHPALPPAARAHPALRATRCGSTTTASTSPTTSATPTCRARATSGS